MSKNKTLRMLMALALCLTALAARAQSDLAVGEVFQKYGSQKGCKLVTLYNGKLKGYQLKTYISLTYSQNGPDINRMLQADREQAKKIREIVVDGKVSSGFYQMKSQHEGTNRYVLFRRTTAQSGAVVYIEGALSPDDILKLCTR